MYTIDIGKMATRYYFALAARFSCTAARFERFTDLAGDPAVGRAVSCGSPVLDLARGAKWGSQ